jgi:carboxylesterase
MLDSLVDERARAFEFDGDRGAVLCLHGFTGSPYEYRPLAQHLSAAGYRVRAPRLAGHGETPAHLAPLRWEDWLSSARQAFDALAEDNEKVFIVGHSMGALIALVLGHERGARVGGIVAMSTPLVLDMVSQAALTVIRRLPFSGLLPDAKKKDGPDVSDPAVAAAMPSYDRMPLAAAASLLDGQAEAKDRATRLSAPVLIQHGRHDHTAPVRNASMLYKLLKTPRRRQVIYPRSWHILPLDVEHEAVNQDVLEFLDSCIAHEEVETSKEVQ